MSDNERQIRHLLHAEADRAPQPTGITSATVRRAQLKRAAFLTTSILGVAIITGGLAVGVTSIGNDVPPVPPAQNEDTTPTDLNPRVTARIPVGSEPLTVVVGEGAVWVAFLERDGAMENYSVARIDPESNEVVARIPVEVGVDQMAVGFGTVWAGGSSQKDRAAIVRIDPQSNEVVATIPGVTHPEVGTDMVSGGGAVWAIAPGESPPESHSLARIDPATNEIVSTIPMGPIADIAVGEGAVWVLKEHVEGATVGVKDVARVDPATNRVTGTAALDAHYIRLAAGAGAVWAPGWLHDFADVGTGAGDRPVVVRIDPETAEISQEPIRLHTTFRPFGVGAGGVWIISGPEKPSGLCRLNQLTLEVDECVEPGTLADSREPAFFDQSSLTIWAVNEYDTVTRIDLQ